MRRNYGVSREPALTDINLDDYSYRSLFVDFRNYFS